MARHAEVETINRATGSHTTAEGRALFRIVRSVWHDGTRHSFARGECFAVPAGWLDRARLRDIRKAMRRRRPGILGFPFVEPSEDHLAGGRLMDRRDRNVHRLVDQSARPLKDDHRAVIRLTHTLVLLLAPPPTEQA